DHRVSALALSLHAQPTPAMHKLAHHRIRKPRLNLIAQRLTLHLKRRHPDGLESSRQLILSNRLVALSKTGDEAEHQDEEGSTKGFGHRWRILSYRPRIFTERFRDTDCFSGGFDVVDA